MQSRSRTRGALRLFQAIENTAGALARWRAWRGRPCRRDGGTGGAADGGRGGAARSTAGARAGHWPPFRERIEAALRAASLEQEYAAAWAEGRAMSLEQAIAYALEEASG